MNEYARLVHCAWNMLSREFCRELLHIGPHWGACHTCGAGGPKKRLGLTLRDTKMDLETRRCV